MVWLIELQTWVGLKIHAWRNLGVEGGVVVVYHPHLALLAAISSST